MASGKTTFGRALSRQLDIPFYDLDFYITQRWRMSVAEIFAQKGEAEFRRMEHEMLHEVGEFDNVIISCGGGTPCYFDNIDYMLSRGHVIWLDADVPTTVRRILLAPGKRPSVAGKSETELHTFVAEHLASRLPFYTRAHYRLPSNHLESRQQIADTVAGFLRAYPIFSNPL